MTRHLLRDALLALGLALLALVCLELVARTIEPDDRKSRIQRFEAPPPRSDDTFRVFTFGSSSVYGIPVPELGLVAQLRYWLERNVPEGRVEVFNYAVPGAPSWGVRDAVLEAIEWEPDLIFVHTGWGEFLLKDPPPPSHNLLRWAMRNSASVRIARRLAGRIVADRTAAGKIEAIEVRPFDRDSTEFRDRVARNPRNLERIVAAAREKNVPLLLATITSNLAEWPPTNRSFASELYPDGFVQELSLIQSLLDAGGAAEARALAEKHLRDRPDDAMLLYLLAHALAQQGDYDRARELFIRARDLDPIPWRVPSEINDLIRATADDDGVILVDIERALAEHSPNGLIGFEMIADNTHPTPRGAAVIADAILRAMARHGLGIAPDAAYFSLEDPFPIFLRHAEQAAAPRDLEALVWAKSALHSMGYPFHNFAAARMYLQKLLLRHRNEWGAWANLASISLLEGNLERASLELRRAAEVKGDARGLTDPAVAPHLQRALDRAGLDVESILLAGRVR